MMRRTVRSGRGQGAKETREYWIQKTREMKMSPEGSYDDFERIFRHIMAVNYAIQEIKWMGGLLKCSECFEVLMSTISWQSVRDALNQAWSEVAHLEGQAPDQYSAMGERFPRTYVESVVRKVRLNPLGIQKLNHSKKRWLHGTPKLPRSVIRELPQELKKEYEDSFPVHVVTYDTNETQHRARIGA